MALFPAPSRAFFGDPALPRRVPPGPLAFLFLALLASAAPLWDQAPAWSSFLFVGCAAVRLFLNSRGLPPPPLALRLLLLAGAVTAIVLQHGGLFRLEPLFAILLVLVSLKLLETHRPRDFQILLVLGYFLGLCGLLFAQELNRGLYVGASTLLLTAAQIRLQDGAGRGAFRRSLQLAGSMLAQAFPLVVFLFLFCPRPHADLRLSLGPSRISSSGMSDHLQPGSVAALALRSEVAFHAKFPDGNAPPAPERYWRGPVLWAGNGLAWEMHERGRTLSNVLPGWRPHAPLVRQRITLEPHGAQWLFALDRPVRPPPDADFYPGGDLRNRRTVMRRMTYDVVSQSTNDDRALPPDQLKAARQLPAHVSPEVRALAASFREGGANDLEVVQRALNYFRKGGFVYSIEPGTYSNELDDFLFKRRIGFCEHYAAAYASLIRLAGLPSRVVTGYLGGEYNEIGDYYVVHQSDAHAWCEVWVEGQGWVRVDPTSVTAPDRLSFGLQDFLSGREAETPELAGRIPVGFVWRDLLQHVAMYWDNLSYQWDLRVLSFNDDAQHTFLASLGLGELHWDQLTVGIVIACLLGAGALALWLARPARVADPALRLYARFCRRTAAAGCPREPAEGPLAFTQRVAARFPAEAETIREIGRLFAALRYGRAEAAEVSALARAVREVGLREGPKGRMAQQDLS